MSKSAQWIFDKKSGRHRCSECLASALKAPVSQEEKLTDYCPCCGSELSKRTKGEWLFGCASGLYRCSVCSMYALRTDDGAEDLSDFCPYCGADMR